MTGNEIIDIVRQSVVDDGGDVDDPRIGESFMRRQLNRGADDYYKRAGAGAKSTPISIPQDAVIDIPSDFIRPKQIYNAYGKKIVLKSKDMIMKLRLSTSRTPLCYCIFDRIYFGPKLEVPYTATFDYFAYPAQIVNLAVSTGLTRQAEAAIVFFLEREVWKALEEPNHASIAAQQYESAIEDAENEFDVLDFEDTFDDYNHEWRES